MYYKDLKEEISALKFEVEMLEHTLEVEKARKDILKKQLTLHFVDISEVIKAATNWFAMKEYNKHFNDLTRQEQDKVNKEFNIINDYLKSIK
jgi:hypothetical protein